MPEHSPSKPEPCQLVLVKKDERWVFRYQPGNEAGALSAMAATAGDPASDFDWFDAAVLCNQLGGNLSEKLKTMMPS